MGNDIGIKAIVFMLQCHFMCYKMDLFCIMVYFVKYCNQDLSNPILCFTNVCEGELVRTQLLYEWMISQYFVIWEKRVDSNLILNTGSFFLYNTMA